MDIKLSLDGGFSLKNGDFDTTTGTDETVQNINRLVKGWLNSFAMGKFAGLKNTRETAQYIKKELDQHLRAINPFATCQVYPVDVDAITVVIGIATTDVTLYKLIFNYTEGVLEYSEYVPTNTYRDTTNPYL